MPQTPTTTVIVHRQPKSVVAAFFLTFLFGPIGLLYATVGGGIFLIVVALILGVVAFGLAAVVIWPVSIVWGVTAAILSQRKPAALR